MKIAFAASIDNAPKKYVRVRLTDEARSVRRIVREGGHEWLEIGTGKPAELDLRKFVKLCRAIIKTAKEHKYSFVAVSFDELTAFKQVKVPDEELASIAAQNFVMANFEFLRYRAKTKDQPMVEEVLICGKIHKAVEAATKRGLTVGDCVNLCRELSNTPGGDMTPRLLAAAAIAAVRGTRVAVKVMRRKELEKLKMGALLGVAKGSDEEPTFTVMQYRGAAGKPIVLVGKGITFDTGGINIKSEAGIGDMHMDMSGGAAVIAAVAAAARLKLKKHVVGLIPAAENMPSGGALRPSDVLRSMSGKTIEVGNTDAEGRLILADALTYAKKFDPAVVIDVATLTGAAMVALGVHASGLMTRDDKLAERLLELAERSGDYLWRLPLWDEYEDGLKSHVADLNNVPGSGPGSRYGGATNGGIFLWQFAKELKCPWAHLDIAPRMVTVPSDELAKGAAGTPVRLLTKFIEEWK